MIMTPTKMKNNLLLTFGCSWTFGVGVGYEPGMSQIDYSNLAWDVDLANKHSFRGVLSDALGFDNKNFAIGGGSNQFQFRRAKEYFTSAEFVKDKEHYENIVVLHSITSTARTELFDVEQQKYVKIKFEKKGISNSPELSAIADNMIRYCYDHDNEVKQLQTEMNFWNMFYQSIGIHNIWLDTFNHHVYTDKIDNMIGIDENPRDLLSKLCLLNGANSIDNSYHTSSWSADSNRVDYLVSKGLLNPISLHPTKEAHQQIATLITPYIQNRLK